MSWRIRAIALVAFSLQASLRVASAQASDTTACHGSVDRKAVAGRVVDPTGAPMLDVMPRLETRHRDTTYQGGFVSITSAFIQIAKVDASGQFCFRDVPAGDYRFEARAMRIDGSRQAIIIHLGTNDSLKVITLRYRPWGLSPEEEWRRAERLAELESNRNQWSLFRPRHYLLRVRRDCAFCFGPPPLTYEVVNDVPVAAIDTAGVRRPLRGGEIATIEGVFDALRTALLDEQGFVSAIAYDARLGWPRRYETGSRTLMTDAWAKVTVERFDVIK